MVAILFLLFISRRAAATGQCARASSMLSYRFHDDSVFLEKRAADLKSCFEWCKGTPTCFSANYHVTEGTCELNSKNHITHPEKLEERTGFVYLPVLDEVKPPLKSCAQLMDMKPAAASGIYKLQVNGLKKDVYCDMDKFGGGWSLVVSVSGSNIQHILQGENNCYNSSLCVPLATGTLVARKHSDADIRALASHEGTFRVDVTSTVSISYTVFYRLPKGAQYFDSGCSYLSCPRIIISHKYPYVWESNCKGIAQGYRVDKCHRVFDGHDDRECGGHYWSSSQYPGKRVLYSHCDYIGMYSKRQGSLYVR